MRVGDIVDGNFNGSPCRFQIVKWLGIGGAGEYGIGEAEQTRSASFMKCYNDPTPNCVWFSDFVSYQCEVIKRMDDLGRDGQLFPKFISFCDTNGFLWQAMEYVEGSLDLGKYFEGKGDRNESISWDQRVSFARAFMYAVSVLHTRVKCIHADLKPANILLVPKREDQFQLKITDFDRPILEGEKLPWGNDDWGTHDWLSPEQREKETLTVKSDIFSCGLILYFLLAEGDEPQSDGIGYSPAASHDMYSSPEKANAWDVPKLKGSFGSESVDEDVAETLRKMLDPDPEKRPSADEVHRKLVQCAPPNTFLNNYVPPQKVVSEKRAADVVFLIDVTGSMGLCIEKLEEYMDRIIHTIAYGDHGNNIEPVPDWRARIVGYRNFNDYHAHPAMYRTCGGWFLSNNFTTKVSDLRTQLSNLTPFGGGSDLRESLLDALMLVMEPEHATLISKGISDIEKDTSWRSGKVAKVIVVFTDAGYCEMSYDGLRGCGLDELSHVVDMGGFKICLFAPQEKYLDFRREINGVISMDDSGDGPVDPDDFLQGTFDNADNLRMLIERIGKVVSDSARIVRAIPR